MSRGGKEAFNTASRTNSELEEIFLISLEAIEELSASSLLKPQFSPRVHHTNEYLMYKSLMNPKGYLRSAQIFNAASPPINPIFLMIPLQCLLSRLQTALVCENPFHVGLFYSCNTSVCHRSARNISTGQLC